MATQANSNFGEILREALDDRGMNQAELARLLRTSPSGVSRWIQGRTRPPHADVIREIARVLDDPTLFDSLSSESLHNHVYIAAPIVGLGEDRLEQHVRKVRKVVASVDKVTGSYYWPGSDIESTSELLAADIATEKNMNVLAMSQAFLYLQFDEIVRPTSALVELGVALGRKMPTTIILADGVTKPFMFDGFPAVAAKLHQYLPQVHLYTVKSPAIACQIVERNATELFGRP